MAVDYLKLKQVVSLFAATIAVVVSLLEQVGITSGMSYASFSILVRNENQKQRIFVALLHNYDFFSFCQHIAWRELNCLDVYKIIPK